MFLNGILNISNCEFAKNKAKFGSALQIETGENDENGLKSKILISDSFFKANTGRGVINMDDFNVYSHLETKNCNFEDNQSCVLLSFDN